MARLAISSAVAYGLLLVAPNFVFAQNLQYSDVFITPETNPSFFSGYVGGNGDVASDPDGWIDWSIGNGVPFNTSGSDDLVISTNIGDYTNSADWIQRMRITDNGYIGIGTEMPTTNLQIGGSLGYQDNPTFAIQSSGNLNPVIQIGEEFGTKGRMIWLNTHDKLALDTEVAGTHYLWTLVLDHGKVGIGTINPMGTLEVNGSIYQRGTLLHADYVFEPDYKLESIEEHAQHMWENKHLKAIPEAAVDESGQEIIDVGSHRRGIVEELEKAHIYIEQLNSHIKGLEERLAKLEAGRCTHSNLLE
jgi:hypothetical protein